MKRKCRILFILHLPPPVHGAAMMGKYIQESKLINDIFESDYINLSTATSLGDIGKGGFFKFFRFLTIQFSMFKSLLSKRYDLCYVSISAKGAGFYKDFFIVFILRLFRKKIVYHFHNKGVELNRHTRVNDLLYRFVFRNTKSILLSTHLYSDIEYYVDKKDVFFCPNGIPEENEMQEEVSEISGDTVCKIMFLSNMMEEKGVYILLEACKLLKERKIAFECHFVGQWSDVTETDFLNAVRKFNLSDEIFFHGKQYGKDKLAFFKQADIFAFPTFYHNETFGLVIVEAMQQGLPVVTTLEGGIPDVVLDNVTGFTIHQRDAKALTDKLEILIKNKVLREQMGKAGRKRYEELFTLEKFERNFSDILLKVFERNKV